MILVETTLNSRNIVIMIYILFTLKIKLFTSLIYCLIPENKFKSFVFSKCLALNDIDYLMIIEKYGLI